MDVKTAFRAGLAASGLGLCLAACSHVSELETQARILAEPPCTDFFFPIYFSGQSAELNGEAKVLIRSAGGHAKGCAMAKVEVVGLPTPAAVNDGQPELVHERARQVAEALAAAGLPPARFQLSALGEAGAALPNAAVPKRRVDVFIRFER
jgi:outer membrane protein OmpA-like peptidoglycan-associated protein